MRIPRRTAAAGAVLLACAGLAVACGSAAGTGTQASSPAAGSQGTAAANQARQRAAAAFWRLDGSLGPRIQSTGGLGRFAACTSQASDQVVYGIQAAVQPAGSTRPGLSAFTASLLHGFATAGWRLRQAGAGSYAASGGGLSVQLRVFSDSGGPGGSLTVQSGCVNAGGAAHQILADYGGDQSDQYPQGDVSARPVPTTFPAPGE